VGFSVNEQVLETATLVLAFTVLAFVLNLLDKAEKRREPDLEKLLNSNRFYKILLFMMFGATIAIGVSVVVISVLSTL
jgi:hypothetical protein